MILASYLTSCFADLDDRGSSCAGLTKLVAYVGGLEFRLAASCATIGRLTSALLVLDGNAHREALLTRSSRDRRQLTAAASLAMLARDLLPNGMKKTSLSMKNTGRRHYGNRLTNHARPRASDPLPELCTTAVCQWLHCCQRSLARDPRPRRSLRSTVRRASFSLGGSF